jgi:hypothetical protein
MRRWWTLFPLSLLEEAAEEAVDAVGKLAAEEVRTEFGRIATRDGFAGQELSSLSVVDFINVFTKALPNICSGLI